MAGNGAAGSDSNYAAAVGLDDLIDLLDDDLRADRLPDDDVATGPDGPTFIDEDGQELFKRACRVAALLVTVPACFSHPLTRPQLQHTHACRRPGGGARAPRV